MKKLIFAILSIYCFQTQAQSSLSSGVKAGINISHLSSEAGFFDDGSDTYRNFSSLTSFYVGGFIDLNLTKIYTLSPELLYSSQGSEYNFSPNGVSTSGTIKVSYLNMNIVNKFRINPSFYPYAGTSFDFVVEKNHEVDIDSEIDFALFIGAGFKFNKNLGIEVRAKKGLIPVLDYSDGNHNNVVFQFGATYTFDAK
ncbi:MAG: PorT family protein [Flavobacterium sp.]|nr:PorT family protein [Flavobacterium sp.]